MHSLVAQRARTTLTSRLRSRLRTIDVVPVLVGVLFVGIVLWHVAPEAQGTDASSSARVDLGVDTVLAVAPTLTKGDRTVRLSDITLPGQQRNASSDGWQIATNYPSGYEVKIRSTTDPALSGRNAVDGDGARESFQDFRTSGCPCTWSTSGFSRGVFGYSADVSTASGSAALDTSKWGSSGSRKWRGFDDSAYSIFETPGGDGTYALSLHFRTALPDGTTQPAGSYRANVVLSVAPNL